MQPALAILRRSVFDLALLSGCATTYAPKQIAPGRYVTSATSAPGRASISNAQRMALDAADAKCSSLGKQLNVADADTGRNYIAEGRAIVTFLCE